jgi:predicted O-linked N-acetylglucosamine transferase (SPINDLY family)
MGVPFTTLRGDRPAGRAGASLLTCIGLTDLIAETPEQLVQRTVDLAADERRLADLRGELRQRLRQTLCDGAAFTRNLEDVYRQIWRNYCATVAPTAQADRRS